MLDLDTLTDLTHDLESWIEKELTTLAEDRTLEEKTNKIGLDFKILQVSYKIL